eukprot:GHVU01195768.1.p1 GENE.GHVU01195768.1~~GHVU01195768.1.p1  ORF type:complete len:655 (+),score=44.89 GHVU01195768.1:51-2015(+)
MHALPQYGPTRSHPSQSGSRASHPYAPLRINPPLQSHHAAASPVTRPQPQQITSDSQSPSNVPPPLVPVVNQTEAGNLMATLAQLLQDQVNAPAQATEHLTPQGVDMQPPQPSTNSFTSPSPFFPSTTLDPQTPLIDPTDESRATSLSREDTKALQTAMTNCRADSTILDPTDEAELDAVLNEWRTQIIAQGLTEHHLKFMIARKGSHEIRELLKPFTPLHAYRTTDIINYIAHKLLPRSTFHQECLAELMRLTPLSSVRHALKVIRLTLERLEVLRKRRNLGGAPADKQMVQWLLNKLPAAACNAIYKDAGHLNFLQLVQLLESGVLPNQTAGPMPITPWELRLTRPGHRPLQPDVTAFAIHEQPTNSPPPSSAHPPPPVADLQQSAWQNSPPVAAIQTPTWQSSPPPAAAFQQSAWQNPMPPFLQQPQRIPPPNPQYEQHNPLNQKPPYGQSPRQAQTPRATTQVTPQTFITGIGETYAACRRCQKNHIGSCWRCSTCLTANCSHPIPPASLCSNCGRTGHSAASCLNTAQTLQTQTGPIHVVVFTTPRTNHSIVRPHQKSAALPIDWSRCVDQATAIRLHETELANRTRTNQVPPATRSPATLPNTYLSMRPLLVNPPTAAPDFSPTSPPQPLPFSTPHINPNSPSPPPPR